MRKNTKRVDEIYDGGQLGSLAGRGDGSYDSHHRCWMIPMEA
jgi:hypothetical protein